MKNKVTSLISSGLALSALVLGIIASPVQARAQGGPTIHAEIPFPFQAGTLRMPAGDYVFTPRGPITVMLTHRGTGHSAFVTGRYDDKKAPVEYGAIVFTRYGNQNFLSRVDLPNRNVTYTCLHDKKEQSLIAAAKSSSGPQVATNEVQLPVR